MTGWYTRRTFRRRFTSAAVVLATVVSLAGVAEDPAQADVIGTVTTIVSIVSTVRQAYDMFNQYLLGNRPPNQLDDIENLITAQTQTIVGEIDALAAGDVQAACKDVMTEFEGVATDTPTQLDLLYHDAVHCVNLADAQLGQVSNSRAGQPALDSMGFALSVSAPIALVAAVADNQPTTGLTTTIIHAWRTLVRRMLPTCGFTPEVDVEATTDASVTLHSQGGQNIPIPGHGACYSYQVAEPQPTEGSIIVFPTGGAGSGTGTLPWQVTGRANEDFCSGFDFCHHATLGWPGTTGFDFSVAIDQAMAVTSYPIAQASLNALVPAALPVAQPVAVASVDTAAGGPVRAEVFGVKADGSMVRGVLDKDSNDSTHHSVFEGWTAFAGPAFPVASLSAAVTWDGRIQVFALDRIGQLYSTWELHSDDDSAWSPWAHLNLSGLDEGTQFTSVSAIRLTNSQRLDNGYLMLFASTAAGEVVTRTQVKSADNAFTEQNSLIPGVGAWTDWQPLPAQGSVVQVSATGNGFTHSYPAVYAVTRSGSVIESDAGTQGGPWSAWASLGAPGNGQFPVRSLQAVSPGTDDPLLLATANGSQIYVLDRRIGAAGTWSAFLPTGSMYGGIAVAKEGIGYGWPELVGVDLTGHAFTSPGTFGSWSAWTPLSGATLRPYPAGPYTSPVLTTPVVSAGMVAVSWTDMSTNEDTFTVRRVKVGGQPVSVAATLPTSARTGTGGVSTFNDATPDPNAPCYTVSASDTAGTFVRSSDFLCVNPPTVPNVVGQSQTAATSAVQALGLIASPTFIGQPQGNCSLATNHQVLQTSPAAGTVAEPGSTVTLTVCSLATSTMPNVVGSPVNSALTTLANLGIWLDNDDWQYNAAPPGTVLGQSIAAGTVVLTGNTYVDITVSKGPAPTVVPGTGWSEIFPPLISNGSFSICLDVPSGTSSVGTRLQLYHCHGYASNGNPQRWQFVYAGTGNNRRDEFQIMNVGNNLCLVLANASGAPGTQIVQSPCNSADTYLQSQWQILDASTGYINNGSTVQFELGNDTYGLCLGATSTSGANGTLLVGTACTAGGTAADTFELG